MDKQVKKFILSNEKARKGPSDFMAQDTLIQRGSDKLTHWIIEFEKAIKQINAGLL
jgi:hypothetical protein